MEIKTNAFHDCNLSKGVTSGFLENVEIKITSCRKKDGYLLVTVQHGDFEWFVTKTSKEISSLARKLRIINFFRGRNKVTDVMPILKRNNDGSMDCEEVTSYFNAILTRDDIRMRPNVIEFFNVTRFSFIGELGWKGTEGRVVVEMKGTEGFCCNLVNYCRGGKKRWASLKEHCMIFIEENSKKVTGMIQVDHKFSIDYEPNADKLRICIQNACCQFYVRCYTEADALMWKIAADRIRATDEEGITKLNDLESFSAQKEGHANWYVDGHAYYIAVADAMEQAKDQIFITDWLISPTIHLKRDVHDRLYWRLDNLLKRKADQGVKIYILIYKEVKFTVPNKSREARTYLENLHKNIFVQLHPDFALESVAWSNHEKLVIIDQNIAHVGGIDLAFNRYDLPHHPISDDNVDETGFHQWVGKDYNNLYSKDRLNLENMSAEYDAEYRKTHGRTPWHDVASVTYGKAARDVCRHFIQRWNFVKDDQDNSRLPYLIPKSFDEKTFKFSDYEISKDACEVKVQVLRSSSSWSSGHDYTESSIHNAYIRLIENSEKYIYIENQYFISNIKQTKNKIVEALYYRILKAHKNKEIFRLYIVLPLLPSAENDIRYDSKSQTIQTILGYQYKSINRGVGSLFDSLKFVDDISEYISICSVASYGTIDGKLQHEILYVHSKVLIVDDKHCIIGSANINERSLLGSRDSEVSLLIEDKKFTTSTMGNQEYKVGVFSSSLRKRCFSEHCGLLPRDYKGENLFQQQINIDDVVCDHFFNEVWKKTASSNTDIFEKIFAILPSNQIRDFKEETLKRYESSRATDDAAIKKSLEKIKGHLIEFPLHALENEELTMDSALVPDFALDLIFV